MRNERDITRSLTASSSSTTKPRRQEPHRVYIQKKHPNKHCITNNSTAIRFTDTTVAQDVTDLIRSKLGLKRKSRRSATTNEDQNISNTNNRYFNGDKLILVGIITGLQRNVIYFEAEHLLGKQQRQRQHLVEREDDDDDKISSRVDPINIVRTLLPTDNPLHVRDEMIKHLRKRQSMFKTSRNSHSRSHHSNANNKQKQQNVHHTMTMWFFQPGDDKTVDGNDKDQESYLDYVELNGYCSGMDDSSVSSNECSTDDDDDNLEESPKSSNDSNKIQFWNEGDYGYSCLLSSSSSSTPHKNKKYPLSKERYYHDRCIQSIENSTSNKSKNFYKEGYLYKRSRLDPNIWKKVYCVLTQTDLWYISRVILSKNNKTKKQKYRHISLSNALLIPNNTTSTIPNKIEICTARGDVYYFRTANDENIHKFWVEAIENYIKICSENSYLHLAELIMSEEEWFKCNRSSSV